MATALQTPDKLVDAGDDQFTRPVAIDHVGPEAAQATEEPKHRVPMAIGVAQTTQRRSRLLPGIRHFRRQAEPDSST